MNKQWFFLKKHSNSSSSPAGLSSMNVKLSNNLYVLTGQPEVLVSINCLLFKLCSEDMGITRLVRVLCCFLFFFP